MSEPVETLVMDQAAIRDAILSTKPPEEVHTIPIAGVRVAIRGMTAKMRDEWEFVMSDLLEGDISVRRHSNLRAEVISQCVFTVEGEPVFTREDAEALGQCANEAVVYIWRVVNRLSGLTIDEEDEEKNSEGVQPG